MKTVLLIGMVSNEEEADEMVLYQAMFAEGAAKQGMKAEVTFCYYDELCFNITPDVFTITNLRANKDLRTYDLVVFKSTLRQSYVAYAICRYLKMHKVKFFNDYLAYRSLNKLPQMIDMYELGLQFPKTIYLENGHLLIELLKKQSNFPYIVKAVGGSKGNKNYLVGSTSELKDVLQKHPTTQFLVQEYIPNSGDYRIFTAGRRQLLLHRVGKTGSHLHNLSQGATAQALPIETLPKKVRQHAYKIMHKMHASYAGIDVLRSDETGEYYFLEVNSLPGFKGFDVRSTLGDLLQKFI